MKMTSLIVNTPEGYSGLILNSAADFVQKLKLLWRQQLRIPFLYPSPISRLLQNGTGSSFPLRSR